MSSGFFGVLQNDSSSDEDTSNSDTFSSRQHRETLPREESSNSARVQVPSYEDLSTVRVDEETVLEAVYGQEFASESIPMVIYYC